MGVATKSRFALVFLMLLTVGVSLGFPAEDVLDAVYDESESVPYEVTPRFSIAALPSASQTALAKLNSSQLKTAAQSWFAPLRVFNVDAKRSTMREPQLALLCTLLC